MKNKDQNANRRTWMWLTAICLLVPLQLGAKGCDTGVVGNDATLGKACGGMTRVTCGTGQFCKFATCENDAADATGICTAVPTVCTDIYQPVCGCDGKTYSSECVADSEKVGIKATGACDDEPPTSCGGITGTACPQGEYCSFTAAAQCGAADQMGTCAVKPEACTLEYAPVCGCDDKTYGNACSAAAAGVSVAASGECSSTQPPDGTVCGGLAGLACPKGEYCNYPLSAQCGAADQTGTCAAIPEVCTMEYAPVCGCDGKTYSNACMAAGAGVSVAAAGKCSTQPPADTACGGLTGLACPTGEYCNYPLSAQCGAADQMGVCSPIPEACDLMYSPVCGCDDKTYGNACSAAAAGVSVAATGECSSTQPPTSNICGGLAGRACPKGEYCNYPLSALCGAADQTGTCAAVPEACTMQYAPVCGCDGKTYSNACMAAGAGVSVSANGACAS